MRALPWLSDTFRHLKPRERRVVLGGAVVSATALVVVLLDRVDAAGEPRPDKPGLLAIPVQLQGRGDVYGLVDFLYRLQHGEKLLVTDELSLNAGFEPVLTAELEGGGGGARPQNLSWSLRLHGLYGAATTGEGGGGGGGGGGGPGPGSA